jgi:hypothetical protein
MMDGQPVGQVCNLPEVRSTTNRREVCRTLLRGAALATISLASGALMLRDVRSRDAAQCRRLPTCEGCAAWSDCRRPQAVANRRGRTS